MAEHDEIVKRAAEECAASLERDAARWWARDEYCAHVYDFFAAAVAAARKEAREGALEEATRLCCLLCVVDGPPIESTEGTTAGSFLHPDGLCRATAIWRALRSKPEEPSVG